MRFLTSIGFSNTSKPATVALPSEGGRKHVRTRIVVVFPAPLGPRKPTICPLSTSKEILSTATVRAYRLVRPSTLIIWFDPGECFEPRNVAMCQLPLGMSRPLRVMRHLNVRVEYSSY